MCILLRSCFSSMEGHNQSSLAAIFRQSVGYGFRRFFLGLNVCLSICRSFNCSEVCSKYIGPVGLFNAIFGLTDFLPDPYDISSSKQDEHVAPSGH